MSPDNKDIQKLQLLEQSMQNVLAQKNTFQTQLTELENALNEVTKSSTDPFKIVGGIMIESKKSTVIKDLKDKKEMLTLRVTTLEKQENKTREQIQSMQSDVVKSHKK
tara:strand:+ start:1199 stop:1522 length:324 start_codon:yes stop_codon:yes gene_type:complete